MKCLLIQLIIHLWPCSTSVLNKVPRVSHYLRAQIPFKCPSAQVLVRQSAQVLWLPKYLSTLQVPKSQNAFECLKPKCQSGYILFFVKCQNVLQLPKFPSAFLLFFERPFSYQFPFECPSSKKNLEHFKEWTRW